MKIASTFITDTKFKVHASYTDGTEIDVLSIDTLPAPENRVGKIAVLYFNPITKELFYEYEDLPLSATEKMQAEKIANIENQTAEYMVDLDFRLSNIELGL